MSCTQAPLATKEELAAAHDAGYVTRVFEGRLGEKEMRSIGFPWSQGLLSRSRASAGGTLAAMRALLEWKLRITANIAGTAALAADARATSLTLCKACSHQHSGPCRHLSLSCASRHRHFVCGCCKKVYSAPANLLHVRGVSLYCTS